MCPKIETYTEKRKADINTPVLEMTDISVAIRLPTSNDNILSFSCDEDLIYVNVECDDKGILYFNKFDIRRQYSDYISLSDLTGGMIHDDFTMKDNLLYIRHKDRKYESTSIIVVDNNFDILKRLNFNTTEVNNIPDLSSVHYLHGKLVDISSLLLKGVEVAFNVKETKDGRCELHTVARTASTLEYKIIDFTTEVVDGKDVVANQYEVVYNEKYDCSDTNGIMISNNEDVVYFKELNDNGMFKITAYNL